MLNTVALDNIIYLDHAAATPLDKDVARSMQKIQQDFFGNPSSLHTHGRKAQDILDHCRTMIAQTLQCLPEEIIFTGSGTESDNLALIGTAQKNKHRGNHIIISAIEHKAILASAQLLEQKGFSVTTIPVDHHGMIDITQCIAAIRSDTILVSIIYANNEIGTIQPIKKLSKAIRAQWTDFPLIHTDACQAAGLLPISPNELGVDLLTLNSSKIYGPKGVGLLYKKKTVSIQPIIVGGEQEMGLRAGTENIALAVGFTNALVTAEQLRNKETKRLEKLQTFFIQKLREAIPQLILNGHPQQRLANNIHISIPNIEGESLLLLLDAQGIAVSTGSACSSFNLAPSHVLLAIGQSTEIIHGSLRFSLGRSTTKKDLITVVHTLKKIVQNLTQISALTTYVYEKK